MTEPHTLDAVIARRQTTKVFADEPLPPHTDREAVEELVAAAAWAPFHRPAHKSHSGAPLASPVPWRFHLLDAATCRVVRERLLAAGDAGKLPNMLAAATTVVQATWLPDPPRETFEQANPEGLFEPTLGNMEHIAAAAAAIQNLLLAATDRGLVSYWSSGGALRQEAAYDWLAIPSQEILLGAIFLFPSEEADTTRVPGKLRERRGATSDWSRWVEIAEETVTDADS